VREVDSATPQVHYIDTTAVSPLTAAVGGNVSISATLVGAGTGPVEYHWVAVSDGTPVLDSGPLTVQMTGGAAAVPPYSALPTAEPGNYTCVLRVTSQSPVRESLRACYGVLAAPPQEITIDLPGLPAGAVPLTLVRVPAGSFLMGRTPGEPYSQLAEDYQHEVDIGHDFYLGKYELTQAQWYALMTTQPWQDTPRVPSDPNAPAAYFT